MDETTETSVLFENIPLELKKIPRWVMWKYVEVGDDDDKRLAKLPVQTNGISASSTNPDTWTDFLSVQDAYSRGNFSGVGFVFTKSDKLAGVDIDDCRDPNTGELTQFAQDIVAQVKGYVEVSPSGTGIKIFTLADITYAHVDHKIGLECYGQNRYFTVTGNKLQGDIPDELQDVTSIIPERIMRSSGDAFADYTPPVADYDIHRVETELLSKLNPNCGYSEWLSVGQALHHQFDGDVEACELWDRWSQNGLSYKDTGSYSCDSKWRTFKGQGTTLRTLIFKVNQQVREEAIARGEVILDQGAMNHARTFLDTVYSCEEGYKVVHYTEDFYLYAGTHYEVIEEATVRAKLYAFLDKCKKSGKKGELMPFNPTPASVSGALDAVKAVTHLENHANTKPPIWLERYVANKPEAEKLISMENGLFHLEDNLLIPHSLGFFTQNSLPFSYDPGATSPLWTKFMDDVFGEDVESIHLLQEYFGYILSGDTKQQKFLNIIGPRRSGKGTINKVLVTLLGDHNTVAPQLEELCDTFGLQSWIGKPLASFTDARAPERNRSAVVSQLLRIVGGDTVTVNRKNKEAWNGYLPTRIIIYSNEMLQLTENSNALTGRMLVIKMTNSFYGKEDTELYNKLSKELAGIFNWAMEGNKRRLARGGHFYQPESGKEYLELMAEMGNPIGTFVEDALTIDPEATVSKDDVFACFKHWALKKSIPPGTELAFKRRFLAGTQEHRVTSCAERVNGSRTHLYRGVKLNEKAQRYLESISSFDTEIF